jgi:hypothetical protein
LNQKSGYNDLDERGKKKVDQMMKYFNDTLNMLENTDKIELMFGEGEHKLGGLDVK